MEWVIVAAIICYWVNYLAMFWTNKHSQDSAVGLALIGVVLTIFFSIAATVLITPT